MNRNLRMATVLGLAVVGAGTASAQLVSWPIDQVIECLDPASTTSPYSADFGIYNKNNDLFGVSAGLSGTVNYSKFCWPPNGITVHSAGRIGFYGGALGSVQDEAYGGAPVDNFMSLTYGAPNGIGGNWGYGVTVRQASNNGAITRTAFGKNAIDEAFVGASDRYYVLGSTNDNIRVTLRVDVLGDAGRLQWNLLNRGAAGSIGFDFGQWVVIEALQYFFASSYIDVPGFRPLTTDHRFARNPSQITQVPDVTVYPMPPYANFGMTRDMAYGLSVPTQANAQIPDQTPVDILDIGKIGAGWLLGSASGDDQPMPAYDTTNPPVLLDDTEFIPVNSGFGGTAYVQRWLPVAVNQGSARTITAYYRTTWGVSDYDKPYSAVVDTPKVVAVDSADPTTFLPNPMVVRVYVDNTRGFSSVDAPIPLNDVRVTLNLPQGMSDAADSTHTKVKLVKTITRVEPKQMNFVDFQVRVDPTTYGIQQYNVKIEPNPGPAKTLTGTINVASQPYLLIRPSANLVAAPWVFAGGNNWNAILNSGSNPLVPDVDFQAYEWDAAQQAYVVQTGPRRGFGTWLISNKDAGFKQLGSTPTPPPDITTGADLIVLRPGWNLIANPYNYSIPIGQIVGVSASDPRNSQSFQTLADSNLISSSLAYWDQNTQSYKFTSGVADLLVPNRGYWIFVNSAANLTLSFPPVNTAFVPLQPGEDTSPFKPSWKLKLAVRTAKASDTENIIGAGGNAASALKASVMKPPVAPVANAVSGSFVTVSGSKTLQYATSYQPKASMQQWNWQVFTRASGVTTLSWPVPTDVPKSVKLTLTDLANGRSYDMRSVQTVSYVATSQSIHKFKVEAVDGSVIPPGPVLSSVSTTQTGRGAGSPVAVNYTLTGAATTTVRILSGSKEILVLKKDASDTSGNKSVVWNLTGANGKKVAKGSYVAEVAATAEGRTTEKKTAFIFVY